MIWPGAPSSRSLIAEGWETTKLTNRKPGKLPIQQKPGAKVSILRLGIHATTTRCIVDIRESLRRSSASRFTKSRRDRRTAKTLPSPFA